MDKGVFRSSVHSYVSYYHLNSKTEILLVPLKQLLRTGSQTAAHVGFVKHMLEMLDSSKIVVWG